MVDAIVGHLVEIVKMLIYAICGAIIMGISLGVFLRILQRITPDESSFLCPVVDIPADKQKAPGGRDSGFVAALG